MRGKLHVTVLDESFPGDVREGMELLVPKIRAAINVRFQNATTKPSVVFTDRGKGFYFASTGKITPEYKAALGDAGLTAYWGDDASAQPGNLQEMMLHETTVSWMRTRLSESARVGGNPGSLYGTLEELLCVHQ